MTRHLHHGVFRWTGRGSGPAAGRIGRKRDRGLVASVVLLAPIISGFLEDRTPAHEDPATQELELLEVATYVIPDSLVITQGVLLPGAGAVIWGADNAWLIGPSGIRSICHEPVDRVFGARPIGDTGVEFLSRTSLHAADLDEHSCSELTSDDGATAPLAGAGSPRGWWTLTHEGTLSSPTGTVTANRVLGQIAGAASDSIPPWFAATPSGAIVGLRTAPGTWAAWSENAPLVTANPLEAEEVRSMPEPMSMGVVPLDRGYLQVVADLTRETRALLRYDAEGRVVRVSQLPLPFGLLDSDPTSKRLLALRRSDRLEVVVYQYRWIDA